MALIHAELGERETAAAMVEQLAAPGFSKFRHDMLFLPGLAHLTLVCSALADSDHAEAIYDLLRPYAGRVVIVGAPAQACWGPVDHYLGILAGLAERPDWAIDHFEAALMLGARLGTPAVLAETRLEFGTLLLHADECERRERALALLDASNRTAVGARSPTGDRSARRRRAPPATSGQARWSGANRRRRRRPSAHHVARCAATASTGR